MRTANRAELVGDAEASVMAAQRCSLDRYASTRKLIQLTVKNLMSARAITHACLSRLRTSYRRRLCAIRCQQIRLTEKSSCGARQEKPMALAEIFPRVSGTHRAGGNG